VLLKYAPEVETTLDASNWARKPMEADAKTTINKDRINMVVGGFY
jgi:hypothetical protein